MATITEDEWKDHDFLTFDNDDDHDDEDDEDDDQVDNEDEKVTDGKTLPPWMSEPHRRTTNPLIQLHNEIVDFCSLMEPREEEIEQRKRVVERFKKLVATEFGGPPDCQVELFGSQATGLFLPSSDIDLVLLVKEKSKEEEEKEEEDMENWRDSSKQTPLHRLADLLREKWQDDLAYLEVIENTRVPLVKLTLKQNSLSMDICCNQENGHKAATLMTTFLEAMPPLRPLTFVLKYFLASRGMNEPYSGGIGSYLLQLMIVSFLQHRERDGYNYERPSLYNLGALLLDFLELYGMDFNYITTGFSVRHDGFYFPKGAKDRKPHFWNPKRPFSISCENPLEPTVDVGTSSFKISIIQRSLEVAFKVLLAHVTEPQLQATSLLAAILPPTKEMRARAGQTIEDMVESEEEDLFAQDTPEPKRRRLG